MSWKTTFKERVRVTQAAQTSSFATLSVYLMGWVRLGGGRVGWHWGDLLCHWGRELRAEERSRD